MRLLLKSRCLLYNVLPKVRTEVRDPTDLIGRIVDAEGIDSDKLERNETTVSIKPEIWLEMLDSLKPKVVTPPRDSILCPKCEGTRIDSEKGAFFRSTDNPAIDGKYVCGMCGGWGWIPDPNAPFRGD